FSFTPGLRPGSVGLSAKIVGTALALPRADAAVSDPGAGAHAAPGLSRNRDALGWTRRRSLTAPGNRHRARARVCGARRRRRLARPFPHCDITTRHGSTGQIDTSGCEAAPSSHE